LWNEVIARPRGVVDGIWPTPWQTCTCIGKWHLGLNWVDGKPGSETKLPIGARMTGGPNAIRTKGAADETLKILAEHGWTIEVSNRPRVVRAVGEANR
jgi:hypothetical protein